jgi:hypothetical protein
MTDFGRLLPVANDCSAPWLTVAWTIPERAGIPYRNASHKINEFLLSFFMT